MNSTQSVNGLLNQQIRLDIQKEVKCQELSDLKACLTGKIGIQVNSPLLRDGKPVNATKVEHLEFKIANTLAKMSALGCEAFNKEKS
jgi:hypothetical protein